MPEVLYLDTARLGKMSLGAQHAQSEFHSLAGDIGCSMYFEEFLHKGFPRPHDGLPPLNTWRGIGGLQQRLKRFVGAPDESRVLLANRSSQLMKLAAHLLAGRCRHVLITNLCWPSYARILRTTAAKYDCSVSCLPLRQQIFADRMTAADLIEAVCRAYQTLGCDGLFLPLVDNLGIHFPVRECIRASRANSGLQFVAVDGAQALGHVPVQLADMACDVFIAGCHKWLRAYRPLGLAFFGRQETRTFIEETTQRLSANGLIDDPLLDFVESLRSGNRSSFGETVNLSPLFTCHGALEDAEENHQTIGSNCWQHEAAIREATDGTLWKPIVTDVSVRSNIFMLEPRERSTYTAEDVRSQFHRAGIALTAYANGSVRLSLPLTRLTPTQRQQMTAASRVFQLRRDRVFSS